MTWTPERKKLVKEMLIEGLTGQQMADRLGNVFSRNAVLSFIYRNKDLKEIGLKRSPGEHGATVAARVERIKATISRNDNTTTEEPPIPIYGALEEYPELYERFDAPHVVGMELTMLNNTRCKWPVNNGNPFLFCGCAKKSYHSYCDAHAKESARSKEGA